MEKILTVAVLGCGARGFTYPREMVKLPDKFKIVAGCDVVEQRAKNFAKHFGIAEENIFFNEEEFLKEKRADLLIVATQDQDHVRHSIRALELGYDLLLEKPVSDKESECRKLLKAQKKYGGKILVCHVLRYAPAFLHLKKLLDSGVIGDIVLIDHLEMVWYFHQAHSFVRGNWRRRDETSPMIIAKCCHDLDLLQWYAGSKCESISSIGDLRFFKKENQPKEASDRCWDCKLNQTCPYSAVRGYKLEGGWWGCNVLTDVRPVTQEAVDEALKTGPYGRCVFACDNDVVDNQIVMMKFKNGINANLRMTAFTGKGGRIIKFYGTHGEIDFEEDREQIIVKEFGKEEIVYNTKKLIEEGYGHGGGDAGMVNSLYNMILGTEKEATSLEASIESHLMGFAAEKSRLKGGKVIKIKH